MAFACNLRASILVAQYLSESELIESIPTSHTPFNAGSPHKSSTISIIV
jgi:hypothetical protein